MQIFIAAHQIHQINILKRRLGKITVFERNLVRIAYGYGPKDHKNSLLRQAIKQGHIWSVRRLLKSGADINTFHDYPLRMSAKCGYIELVMYLVSKGARIDACNHYALRYAAAGGHLQIVQFLMFHGADMYAVNNFALRAALSRGQMHVVDFLLQCDPNLIIIKNGI